MPHDEARMLSRHPFQVWALFAFVIGGVGALVGPPPESVAVLVDPRIRTVWAVVLFAGGTVGLVSEVLRDRILGLIVERAALVAIAGAALAYGVAVIYAAGFRGGVAGALVLSVGTASGVRAWQVTRTLNRLADLAPPP